MAVLILGLVLFLGVHSTRIVADGWRTQMIARLGEKPWKGVDAVLFGAFLLWAVFCFRAARARDRAAQALYPPGTVAGTSITVGVGIVAWAVFAFWAHGALIGVRPLG